MNTYYDENLSSILAAHKLWIEGKPGGVRADLRGADLIGAYLREDDLSGDKLSEADLSGAKQ